MVRDKKKFDIEQQGSTDPYKTDFLSKIPSWLKILILKYWAAAAAVFFIGIGGAEIGLDWSTVDTVDNYWYGIELGLRFFVLLTLFLALVMNYIVKWFGLMMNTSRDPVKKYLFITRKGFLGFLLNILYNFIVMIPIFLLTVYFAQNDILPSIFGSETAWGLEPFSMGLFYVIIDFIFMTIKTAIIAIYKRYKTYKINTAN